MYYIPTRSERFQDARELDNPHGKESTDKVAKATGVSASVINGLENNDNHGASCNAVAALAKYYNISADYLLCITDVKELDQSIQAIGRYTGLSDSSVTKIAYSRAELSKVHQYFDMLISSDGFDALLYSLYDISDAINNSKLTIKNAKQASLDQGNTELAAQFAQERLEMLVWKAQKAISDICYELFPIKEVEDKLLLVRKTAQHGEHKES